MVVLSPLLTIVTVAVAPALWLIARVVKGFGQEEQEPAFLSQPRGH
jgi:hypothetical protein